jgi:DEAD/DEAH box helicase domain-containing protein
VERELRAGEVLGVVATNALELGIDVGELDAVVCAGYPGSVAETWQRFGRAGRRGALSLAVLIASSAPLDQYLAAHPEHLLDGASEDARIDPENTEILVQQLKCAGFEMPFASDFERYLTLSATDTQQALGYLADQGVFHRGRGRFHWAASDAFPANHVSLRRIGWDNFVIIEVASGQALAELDWHSTPSMLHEQAIYQHEGEQYQVERLDYENHKAYVRKVEPDYFTTALRHRKVSVLEERAAGTVGTALAGWGEVSLVEKVVGYKKVKFHTHENAGYGDVRLPEIEMHTTSFWLTVPEAAMHALGRAAAVEGLAGFAHALEIVATLALMCDPHDIGCTLADAAPEQAAGLFEATAYLYDNVPCGVGLAERMFERSAELCARAATLIRACPCQLGCPSCVGAAASGDRRTAALRLVLALGLAGHERLAAMGA